jgi:ParB/RepB/Spo0J family partition protein
MTVRKKGIKDLSVGFSNTESIDDLINNDVKTVLNYTSPSAGKTIALSVYRFNGDDILNKTKVHPKNRRKQVYLTALSLSRLINSLQKNNQVSPALGRLEDDGSITIIYGSRRRMGAHFAETEYVVLASKDLTDDIAEEISDAENISEDISLIERGHLWLSVQTDEGLSSREISEQIEDSKVSHTIIAAGIAGAKLPLEVIKLYPSTNTIGRQTISKLSTACNNMSSDKIVNFVTEELAETIINLWDAHREDNFNLSSSLTTELTNRITNFCTPKKESKPKKLLKTNKEFAKGINAKLNKDGSIEYITFDESLSKATVTKVQEFFKNLV